MSNDNIIEELDMDDYYNGIKYDLQKVGVDLSDNIFPDSLVGKLDELVQKYDYAVTGKFNRVLFQHVLDFKGLNKKSGPISVSEFFVSYFQAYESMRKNRDLYGRNCMSLKEKINTFKIGVEKEKETERVLEDGRTNNSKVNIEIKDIEVFQESSADTIETIFKGKKILFELRDKEDDSKKGLLLKEISINEECLNNRYQFVVDDISKYITISFQDDEETQVLDGFYPREMFDHVEEKLILIPEKGKIFFDIVYINSNVNYINRLIAIHEKEYEDYHVHYDNLENAIGLMEEPFKTFMDKHNSNVERKKDVDSDPNYKGDIDFKNQSYEAQLKRKQMEVSEKVESIILKVSGKKNIIWDTIFFLLNKIMLSCIILVLMYRSDYITVNF